MLTVSNGYGLEEAATDEMDAAAIRRLADALVERALAYRPPDGQAPLEIAGDGAVSGDFATPMEQDPADLPLADKVSRFDTLRRALRDKDERTVQAICQYTDQEVQQVFANRGGLNTQQIRRISLALIPFLSDGTRQEYSYLARTGTGGLEKIELPDEALGAVSEEAAAMLTAVPVPPGTFDVVTDTVTTGVIAHEAFGHGMETDMFLKERARAADYIGKRVGSDLVNIVDDPSMPGAYGSYFVDDEGREAGPDPDHPRRHPAGRPDRPLLGQPARHPPHRQRPSRERAPQGVRANVEHLLHARLQHPRGAAGQPGRRRPAAADAERDGGSQGLGHPDLGPLRASSTSTASPPAGSSRRSRSPATSPTCWPMSPWSPTTSGSTAAPAARAGRSWSRSPPAVRTSAPAAGWPEHGPAPDRCPASATRRCTTGPLAARSAAACRSTWSATRSRTSARSSASRTRSSSSTTTLRRWRAGRGAAKVPVSRADLERLPEVLETLPPWPAWSTTRPGRCRRRTTMPEVELADASLTSVDGALAAARRRPTRSARWRPTRRPTTCGCRRRSCS